MPSYFWAGVVNKLRLSVHFGKRNLQVGNVECRAASRNSENRSTFPPFSTARGYIKSGWCFAKMRNGYLEVLASHADFANVSDVQKVPTFKTR